jgi:hypothetical protein
MHRNGQEVILDTYEETQVLWAGIEINRDPKEYISSQLENDLVNAVEARTRVSDIATRVRLKEYPDFYFTDANSADAKEALESVIAQDGLQGFLSQLKGRKQIAHAILNELAVAEEFTGEA